MENIISQLQSALTPQIYHAYFFATTFMLLILILKDKLSGKKALMLIIFHSITVYGWWIVHLFYGGTGDQWTILGRIRTLQLTGHHYRIRLINYPNDLLSALYLRSTGTLIQSIEITLYYILNVDLFWIHIVGFSIAWSVFIPIFVYLISKLTFNRKVGLLSALVFTYTYWAIAWGNVATNNSLGFLIFTIAIYFSLRVIQNEGKVHSDIKALLLVTVASLFAHSMTGILTICMVILAISNILFKGKSFLSRILKIIALIIYILSIPFSCYGYNFVYNNIYKIAPSKILQMDLDSILLAYLKECNPKDLLIYLVIPFVGIIHFLRTRYFPRRSYKESVSKTFLITLLLANVSQMRFMYYFTDNLPFGILRLYFITILTTVPFFSDMICTIQTTLTRIITINKIKLPIFKSIFICLIISWLLLLNSNYYLSWIINRGKIAKINYSSIATVRFIHQRFNNEKIPYVAIGDLLVYEAGRGLVGIGNPEELYIRGYTEVLKTRSLDPVFKEIQSYSLIYLAISKWSIKRYLGARYNYTNIVSIFSEKPYFVEKVIIGRGDEEISLLRFEPRIRIKSGPAVLVLQDKAQNLVNTSCIWKTFSDREYSIKLQGHTSYRISNWPLYWSFEGIKPNPINITVDANSYVSFTGLKEVSYTVIWVANVEYYNKVIWRDDCISKNLNLLKATTSVELKSDGDKVIINLKDGYVIYELTCNLSCKASGVIFRVKSTQNIKWLFRLYDKTNNIIFYTSWLFPPDSLKWVKFSFDSLLQPQKIRIYVRCEKEGSFILDTIMFIKNNE